MGKGLVRRIIDARWAYLFILPAYIPFIIFIVYPLLNGVRLSFYDATLSGREFIGLENFQRLLQDEAFLKAVKNTIFFVDEGRLQQRGGDVAQGGQVEDDRHAQDPGQDYQRQGG